MNYLRVIPRDLFNEARLLKCLGQLALFVHDGRAGRLTVSHEDPETGFAICQDESDGSTLVTNLVFRNGDEEIGFHSPLNSRRPYPLFYRTDEEGGPVFKDDGTFTEEFAELVGLPQPADD